MMKGSIVLLLLCAVSASTEPLLAQHRVTAAATRLVAPNRPLFFFDRHTGGNLDHFPVADEDNYSDEDPEQFEQADDVSNTKIYEDDDDDDDDDDENVTNDGDNNGNDDGDRVGDGSEETQDDDEDDNNQKIENFRLQHMERYIKTTPLISRDHLIVPNDVGVVKFVVKRVTDTTSGGATALLAPLDEAESPRSKQLIVHRLPNGFQPHVIRIGRPDRSEYNRKRRVNKRRNIRVYVINGKDRRILGVGNKRIKVIHL